MKDPLLIVKGQRDAETLFERSGAIFQKLTYFYGIFLNYLNIRHDIINIQHISALSNVFKLLSLMKE